MSFAREWIKGHPNIWEFILFNVLSNVATVTNFVVMWVCTGFLFRTLKETPFRFLIFNYTNTASELGLCGFLHWAGGSSGSGFCGSARLQPDFDGKFWCTTGGGANTCKCGKHHGFCGDQLSGDEVLDYAETRINTGPVQSGHINLVQVLFFIYALLQD